VPEHFTHIEQDRFYGWPFAYLGPNEDPLCPAQTL
jgi:glucose/arabinose dehydrogenase